jgi:Tol biopolymer transport system component
MTKVSVRQVIFPILFAVSTLVGGAFLLALAVSGCAHSPSKKPVEPGAGEKHFKSLRQLTFSGSNAEAYFSPDGKRLIFQGHEQGTCDQIYMMNTDGSDRKLISTSRGRNTCSYFVDNNSILFASTFKAGEGCPQEVDRSKGYVWNIFKSYNIYRAKADGSDLKPLTDSDGYDAEATVCGNKIVFTSARSGDSLHIYTMNTDGTDVKQLTQEVGYNGGPFFSPDCSRITYRAYHPKKKSEIRKFKKAVRDGYIPQSALEIFQMNADGSNKQQLTEMKTSSFAPSYYPHGDKIMFSSNRGGRVFQLFAIDAKKPLQTEGEQITSEGTFNGFPMFSPDGKFFVFASNRNSANPHELQVFLAEWQD